eukprot:3017272-Ditylum_brightwellii.AAC.1
MKESIDSGEFEVKHCGRDEMITDYFTKPLQGHLFCKFKKSTMNPEDEETVTTIHPPQEHVGLSQNVWKDQHTLHEEMYTW